VSGTHSVLSPSKGAMILRCAAALAAGKGIKDASSEYADEGTAYHWLSALALEAGTDCADYVGRTVHVWSDGSIAMDLDLRAAASPGATSRPFAIDEENAAHAQTYVDAIRRLPGAQYYEVRLDTSAVVGVPGQGGTGDAVVLDFEHDTIHVDDLKFGRGEVVFAEKNEQLIQYGAAALRKFALSHDWKFVKLGIHQPRINHHSEHTYTVEEIEAWVAENTPKFQWAYRLYLNPAQAAPDDYVPGEKQCRWCPIRGKCAARASQFLTQFPIAAPPAAPTTLSDEYLAAARDRVDAIEQWCADIKAEAHTRAVMLGRTLPGWKVVNGRAGNRKWTDEKEAEARLVRYIGEGAYVKKLASPTDAEKAFKKLKNVDGGYALVADLVTQAEGSKSLVRDDSPKQAVATNHAEFPLQGPV
jgi:hypothetical protein